MNSISNFLYCGMEFFDTCLKEGSQPFLSSILGQREANPKKSDINYVCVPMFADPQKKTRGQNDRKSGEFARKSTNSIEKSMEGLNSIYRSFEIRFPRSKLREPVRSQETSNNTEECGYEVFEGRKYGFDGSEKTKGTGSTLKDTRQTNIEKSYDFEAISDINSGTTSSYGIQRSKRRDISIGRDSNEVPARRSENETESLIVRKPLPHTTKKPRQDHNEVNIPPERSAEIPKKRTKEPKVSTEISAKKTKRTVFSVAESQLTSNGWDEAMITIRAGKKKMFLSKCKKEYSGINPMHASVLCRNREMLELSIKTIGNPNMKNHRRKAQTPLQLAAIIGFIEGIEVLIQSKAKLNDKCVNEKGPRSALFLAASMGHAAAVRSLIHAGASLDGTENSLTIFQYSKEHDVFQAILEALGPSRSINPLKGTVFEMDEKIYKMGETEHSKKRPVELLAALMTISRLGAYSPNEGLDWKRLFNLDQEKLVKIATYAFKSGLNLYPSRKGISLLHVAVKQRDVELVDFICDHYEDTDVSVDIEDDTGHVPLQYAARFSELSSSDEEDWDYADILDRLLIAGADVNCCDRFGTTALHYALFSCGQRPQGLSLVSPILDCLLADDDIDFSIANRRGYAPLHIAVRMNLADAVSTILEKGADPNIVGQDNVTPLFIGASKGFLPIVKVLLEHGADPLIRKNFGFNGLSAIDIARKNRYFEMEKLLKAVTSGAPSPKNTETIDDLTPLKPFVQSRHGVEETLCLNDETLALLLSPKEGSRETKISTKYSKEYSESSLAGSSSERDWRTIRLFISSTFVDMKKERANFINTALPLLKKKTEAHKISIVEIDLRWGITKKADALKTAEICLEQLNHSDIFVCFVGHRYGTVVDATKLPSSLKEPIDDLFGSRVPLYSVPRESNPVQKSMTELEMRYAQVNSSLLMRGFYLRKESPKEFCDEDQTAIENFREYVTHHCEDRDNDDLLREFTSAEDLTSKILEDILVEINDRFPIGGSEDLLLKELSYHDRFLYSRIKSGFVERGVLSEIRRFNDSDGGDTFGHGFSGNGPLVVTGPAGSGKSTILAAFVNQLRKDLERDEGQTVLVYHFVGASPAASRVRDVLDRLCRQILRELGLENDKSSDKITVPDDYDELIVCFNHVLQRVPYTLRRLILVVDALNQLDDSNDSQSLKWLPNSFPRGVRVILSANEGSPATKSLLRRVTEGNASLLQLGTLDQAEQRRMATEVLQSYAKRLSSQQMNLLLSKPGVAAPLYLIMALDEMKTFSDTETLTKNIENLGGTTDELFNQIVKRLGREHGKSFTISCLSYIEGSMHGLPEVELLELLEMEESIGQEQKEGQTKQYLHSKWLNLQASIDEYLKPLGSSGESEGELDWFHRAIAKFVRKRFKGPIAKNNELFAQLYLRKCMKNPPRKYRISANDVKDADFHGDYPRALACLPYHLMRQEDTELTLNVMCSLRFLEQKLRHKMAYELLDEFQYLRFEATNAFDFSKNQMLRLRFFRKFLNSQIHTVSAFPEILVQQALNTSGNDTVHNAAAELYRSIGPGKENPHLRLLNRFSNSDWYLMTLMANTDAVRAVCFAPDFSFVVMGGDSGRLLMYTLPSGRLLLSDEEMHDAEITTLDVALDDTGAYLLLSGDVSGALKISDVYTRRIHHELIGTKGSVNAARFCKRKTNVVASCGDDGKLRLWELFESGSMQDTILFSSDQALCCLNWHKNEESVESIVFAGDECVPRQILMKEREILLFGEGTSASHLHTKRIDSISITPNGKYMVSAGLDRCVKIWNLRTRNLKADLKGHNDSVTGVIADDDFVYSVSNDKSLRIWNIKLHVCQSTLQSHSHFINCIALSPKRDTIITGSDDRTARLYSIEELRKSLDGSDEAHAHSMLVRGLSLGESGEKLVSGSWDKLTKVWNSIDREQSGSVPLSVFVGHSKRVNSCVFSPDEKFIVSAGHDSTLRLWHAESERQIYEIREKSLILDCDIARDGRRTAVALISSEIAIWDIMTNTRLCEFFSHESGVNTVRFSRDENSKYLVSSGNAGDVKVWRSSDGQLLAGLNHKSQAFHEDEISVYTATFSPDNTMVCSGGVDKRVVIWRVLGVKTISLVRVLIGHENEILTSDWIDNDHVVTGAADCTIRFWDINTGECQWIVPTSGQVTSMAWNRKKNILICGDGMGNVLHFDASELIKRLL